MFCKLVLLRSYSKIMGMQICGIVIFKDHNFDNSLFIKLFITCLTIDSDSAVVQHFKNGWSHVSLKIWKLLMPTPISASAPRPGASTMTCWTRKKPWLGPLGLSH